MRDQKEGSMMSTAIPPPLHKDVRDALRAQLTMEWVDGSHAAKLLNPLIESRGWTPLNGSDNPKLTRARVVLDSDGDVVGFFCLQMFPMLGPILVVHGSDPFLFRELIEDMRQFLADCEVRGWLIIAEDRRIADLCREMGYQQVPFPVFLGK